MSFKRIIRPAAAGAILFFALAASPVQLNSGALAAIQQVERGKWQFRDLDGSVRSQCITRPVDLLYVGHGSAQCTAVTQRGDARNATVSYSCTGHGQGRASVTVETPRLVRIETSGIRDGAPFSHEFEGRKVGDCR